MNQYVSSRVLENRVQKQKKSSYLFLNLAAHFLSKSVIFVFFVYFFGYAAQQVYFYNVFQEINFNEVSIGKYFNFSKHQPVVW